MVSMVSQWHTGADVMKWWIGQDNRHKEDDASISLFWLMADETDV